jgi:GxxExxY protein
MAVSAENRVAQVIVDACFRIHLRLGPGLLESVYEIILARELARRGLRVQRQVTVPIVWEGIEFKEGFRADLIVADRVVVEIKCVEKTNGTHAKQLLTYLRFANKRLGLLVNFNAARIKDGIRRVVNGLEENPLGTGTRAGRGQ